MKIYTPKRSYSLFKLLKDVLFGFREGKELAFRLFIRDLNASYKKSFLGIFWLFIPPVFTAVLWIFLNDQKVISITDSPMDYAAFTLCGTVLWSLFAEALTKPIQRYQNAMGMMSKLNFPRESLFLASIYDMGFSLFLKLIILVPVLWLLGYVPGFNWLLALIGILGLLFVGLTFGLFISPLGLLYGDIGKGLPLILPFVMYLSPVIYPLRSGGALSFLQNINPVTPFLELSRSSIGSYPFDLNESLFGWSLVSVFVLLFGLITIKVALPVIVERSGS